MTRVGARLLNPGRAGFYWIKCVPTGKLYIGSALWIESRFTKHRGDLRLGKHHNQYLQRAWNKYGESAFEFRILCRAENDMLIALEQRAIDKFDSANRNRGFNILPRAYSALGVKHKPETIAKMRGRKVSPETRAKISAARKGKPLSPEHVALLSILRKGYKPTDATRAKLSIGQKNRKITAEWLAKTRAAAAQRRGRPLSPEHRAKLSLAHRGVLLSPKHRENISCGHKGIGKGVPKSQELKDRISATKRARFESDEEYRHRVKLAASSRIGISLTPEHRAKISAGLKGKRKSEIHVAHVSEALQNSNAAKLHLARLHGMRRRAPKQGSLSGS